MCDGKTPYDKIVEITEKMQLEAIKTWAELGNVELVLKEAESLLYNRSYACYCDNELKKKIDYLYEWGYQLESKIADLEKQLSEK